MFENISEAAMSDVSNVGGNKRSRSWTLIAERVLLDRRDFPFLRLILVLHILLVPLATYFILNLQFSSWVAFVYLSLIFFVFLGPYTLMLHNICHRPVFRSGFKWMNSLVVWLLGPIFGQTPNTYFAHHVGMHHPENNLERDLSSTLAYQRDSLMDFGKYLFQFLVGGIYQLGQYLWKKHRFKLFRNVLVGEGLYFLVAIGTLYFNWKGSLVVFWIPLVVTRFAMITGNWAQHAFIDSKKPDSPFGNSITCIGSTYNRRCFNDGYHIGHHLKMNRHWSEMPSDFVANLDAYRREKAIVFRKLDYFMIWLYLMTGRLDKLASYFVELEPVHRSNDEIVELLKCRLRPFAKVS